MMNVGSLPQGGLEVFSFETQTDIMHVLASIRAADMSSEHKNELRDLVFLYSNGGMDPRVRISLEQKIAAYNLQPIQKTSKKGGTSAPAQESQTGPTIGKFRATPSFSVHKQESTEKPQAQQQETSTPPTPPAPKPDPVPPAPAAVTPPKQEIPVPPPPVKAPTPAPEPAPVSVQPEPLKVPVEPVTTPKEDASAEPLPIPPNENQEKALNRIREIKALVNEKVGNPVNLVDINNAVGREYMSALLEAMKKVNTGSSAAAAMDRLEKAFLEVEKVVAGNVSTSAAESSPKMDISVPSPVSPKSEPVTPTPATPPPPLTPPTPPAPKPDPVPPAPAAVTPPKQEIPVPPPPVKAPTPAPEPTLVSVQPEPLKVPVEPVTTPKEDKTPQPVSGFEKPLATPSTPTTAQKPLASLADLSKPEPQPESKSPTAEGGDPLFTQEIENGLSQLLEEWPIFKKSGLFGTGPKGKEHPLFMKMAPLQIPLILAGRFEGATQEIKQSVTDYMNGWRYEQGLIYEPGETFEHYLRRVIRHILDLQKPRN